MRVPAWRRVALIARIDLRRSWRKLRNSNRGVILLVFGGLAVVLYGIIGGAGAFFLTQDITGEDTGTVRLAATGLVLGLFGIVSFGTLQHSLKGGVDPDGSDGLLTTVPYEDLLGGVVTAEVGRVLVTLAFPVVALTGGVAAGTGSVAIVAVVPVVFVVVAVLGTYVGFGLGLLVKLISGQVAFVARHRGSLGALVTIGLTLLYVAFPVSPLEEILLGVVADSPLVWLADVILIAVPGVRASPIRVLVVAGALVAGIGLGGAVLLELAERVWYADPIQPDSEFDFEERRLSDRLLAGWAPRSIRVVTQKSWLRARRSPMTVQFALVPFFILAVQLQTVIVKGTVPPTLPLTAGLASAATAGAAFTLNPLGGEERVLPLTLTASISGRSFVAGLALAGVVPGLVGMTVLVLGVGAAAGTPPIALGVALVAGGVATLCAPAIAAGAGVVFPKLERSSVGGTEVVVPSNWAFLLYFGVLSVAVAPSGIAFLQTVGRPLPLAVDPSVVLAGGLVGMFVLTGSAALAGFLFAANRVGTYRLD